MILHHMNNNNNVDLFPSILILNTSNVLLLIMDYLLLYKYSPYSVLHIVEKIVLTLDIPPSIVDLRRISDRILDALSNNVDDNRRNILR